MDEQELMDALEGIDKADRDLDLTIHNILIPSDFPYRWGDNTFMRSINNGKEQKDLAVYDLPEGLDVFEAEHRHLIERDHAVITIPRYTGSIDKAIALCEKVGVPWSLALAVATTEENERPDGARKEAIAVRMCVHAVGHYAGIEPKARWERSPIA